MDFAVLVCSLTNEANVITTSIKRALRRKGEGAPRKGYLWFEYVEKLKTLIKSFGRENKRKFVRMNCFLPSFPGRIGGAECRSDGAPTFLIIEEEEEEEEDSQASG